MPETSPHTSPSRFGSFWIAVGAFALFGILALIAGRVLNRGAGVDRFEEELGRERASIARKARQAQADIVEKYAWKDQAAGLVRVPVSTAIDLQSAQLAKRSAPKASESPVPGTKAFEAWQKELEAKMLEEMGGKSGSSEPGGVGPAGKPDPAGGANPPAGGGGFPSAQVMARGKVLYLTKCMACHQINGQGLDPVFPPLAGSPWLKDDGTRAIKIQLIGMTGPLELMGKKYNTAMPPIQPPLTDQQVSDVINYVRNSYSNKVSGVITAEKVAEIRKGLGARKAMWTPAEILKLHPLQ